MSQHPLGLTVHSSLYFVSVYPMGLFYMSGLCLLYLKSKKLFLWKYLAAPGRMALSNYIGQSVIGMLLFAATSCSSNELATTEPGGSLSGDAGKTLIVYFSWGGNTRAVANHVHSLIRWRHCGSGDSRSVSRYLEAVLKCCEKNNMVESFRILSCFLVVFAESHRFRCSHRSLFNSQKHLKNRSQNFLKTFQNSFL